MGDWLKWGNDMASYAKNAANQASALMAGTELEKKLAEATSNEPWGASGAALRSASASSARVGAMGYLCTPGHHAL